VASSARSSAMMAACADACVVTDAASASLARSWCRRLLRWE
jgi:hypothetical protein